MTTSNNLHSLQSGPNCWQCRFFAVTHVTSTPYACKAIGFQSKVLPAVDVLRIDGQFCRSFVSKTSMTQAAIKA